MSYQARFIRIGLISSISLALAITFFVTLKSIVVFQSTGSTGPDGNIDTDVNANAILLMDQAIDASPLSSIYDSSPFLLPLTWGAVVGALFWKGHVKSAWSRQGYDYDIFKLVARMRGSPLRVKLLSAINGLPKNKLQLSKEFGVDWKTVDNHIEILLRNSLIVETDVMGATKYYATSEHGKRILSLLSDKLDQF